MLSTANYLFEPAWVSLEDKKVLTWRSNVRMSLRSVQESIDQIYLIVAKMIRVHGWDWTSQDCFTVIQKILEFDTSKENFLLVLFSCSVVEVVAKFGANSVF